MYVKVDEYGNIPFEQEKERLARFALRVNKEPGMKGFVIAYAGRRAYVGEARARAERAKNYLVTNGRMENERVIAVDGGHREDLTVDLYVVPPGSPAPPTTPTVSPSEVKIVEINKCGDK